MVLITNIPYVVYFHCSSLSQLECLFMVPNICKYGVAACCFDFPGSGVSTGDYISLCYYEKYFAAKLLDLLMKSYNFSKFILWRRSL